MKEKDGLSTDGELEEKKLNILLKIKKKKINERLQQRFDYENASDFYHCSNEDCPRVTFEEALDGMFKCPSCQDVLNIKKNEKSRKAYSKKIDEIKKDMQQTF